MTPAASGVGACVDDLPRISPELVLVDPELSQRVRPRVPLSFRRRRPPLPPLGRGVEVMDALPDSSPALGA
jgi:hypothetical protein